MRVKNFRPESFPFIKSEASLLGKNDEYFRKDPIISAGNFFSFSNIYKNVLEDPKMYFYGDELPMAIRYYTHGINNYAGGESYIYHEYVKTIRKMPKASEISNNETKRFMQLLGLDNSEEKGDIEQFGLGDKRTLEDFEKFSGIDFKNRKIYMCAELGDFEDEQLKTKISYLKERDNYVYQEQNHSSKVEVLVVDLFGEYKQCIDSCLENAEKKDDLSFIVGTISSDTSQIAEKNIKKIIKYDEGTPYSKVLSELTNHLEGDYVAVIDSGYRFFFGWDKYLCDTIKTCGENSVLTSWIWYTNDINKANGIGPFTNSVKEFKNYNNYLPVLSFNYNIRIADRQRPYQTPFISDGFLFCNSKILENIKIDPNLSYKEQNIIYSLRLWTNGVDIFYPKTSYIYKTKSEDFYNKEESHYPTICALQRINNYYSKHLESNYPYDVGNVRSVWSWYDYMKFDYSSDDSFEV